MGACVMSPGRKTAYLVLGLGLSLVIFGSLLAIYLSLTYEIDFNAMKSGLENGLAYGLAVLEYVAVEIAFIGIPVYAGLMLVKYGLEHQRNLPEETLGVIEQ